MVVGLSTNTDADVFAHPIPAQDDVRSTAFLWKTDIRVPLLGQ